MNAIFKRKWYILCVAFGLAAVGAEVLADHFAAKRAVVIAVKASDNDRVAASDHADRSGTASAIGLLLAGLFVLFWLLSLNRREPGLQSVPIVLLALYVMLYLVMV